MEFTREGECQVEVGEEGGGISKEEHWFIRLEYTEYTILQGIGDTSCCEKTMGVLEIIYNTQGGGGKRYGALLQENVFKRNLETISFGIQTLERKR